MKFKKKLGLFTLILLLVLSWTTLFNNSVIAYLDAGIARASITFASARSLNALISFLQSGSLSTQVGVGASIQPGALLDPLDDLIEQFSLVTLVAITSLGIQRIIFEIVCSNLFNLALTIILFLYGLCLYKQSSIHCYLQKILLAVLFVRFLIPTVVLSSEVVRYLVIDSHYQVAQNELSAPEKSVNCDGTDFIGKIKCSIKKYDLEGSVQNTKDSIDKKVKHIISLISLFILETILIPLLVVFLAYKTYRQLTNRFEA
jgi:hypothetical protein